jgi:hypothetical protein
MQALCENRRRNPKFARTGISNGYKQREIEQFQALASEAATVGLQMVAHGHSGEEALAAATRTDAYKQGVLRDLAPKPKPS